MTQMLFLSTALVDLEWESERVRDITTGKVSCLSLVDLMDSCLFQETNQQTEVTVLSSEH